MQSNYFVYYVDELRCEDNLIKISRMKFFLLVVFVSVCNTTPLQVNFKQLTAIPGEIQYKFSIRR